MKLYTIGYENCAWDDFISILTSSKISVVIDIRDIPYSRRREFSKKNLASSLAEAGIEYGHIRELGSPEWLRDRVREDDDYEYFHNEYRKFLQSKTAELEMITQMAKTRAVCLLCYERDFNRCHRRSVAQRVAEAADGSITINHLRAQPDNNRRLADITN